MSLSVTELDAEAIRAAFRLDFGWRFQSPSATVEEIELDSSC